MRLGILAVTCACLVVAAAAEAQDVWIGPQLGFPVPGHDVGDHELGIATGVSFTIMNNPYVGYGVDVLYHYWPASPGYKAAFDDYLRRTRFEMIDSETWAISAFQYTAHVKLAAPLNRSLSPWVQIGAGLYEVDRRLEDASHEGVYVWVRGTNLLNTWTAPGCYGSVGFDFRAAPRIVLGLDASYHHVWSENDSPGWAEDVHAPDFSLFTVGTHVQYGW
jgi:opacity protein-like surface antigen